MNWRLRQPAKVARPVKAAVKGIAVADTIVAAATEAVEAVIATEALLVAAVDAAAIVVLLVAADAAAIAGDAGKAIHPKSINRARRRVRSIAGLSSFLHVTQPPSIASMRYLVAFGHAARAGEQQAVEGGMSEVVVQPVRSRAEQKQFLELPWSIYRNYPNWIPPLRQTQQELVGFVKHPFYEDAQAQAFLATINGKPVGRVHAIMHYTYFRRYGERRGYFGFFESIDDTAVSRALFQAAKAWFAANDVHAFRGPINPSLNYECGLLIEGFDLPPTFMMTYNPPYYPRLVEDFGFQKVQDLFSFYGQADMLAGLDKKLEFVVRECTRRFDIKVRQLNKRRFVEEVKMFLNIYNLSLVGTWGFTPMSDAEVQHAAESMRHLIVPEMTTVAEVDGRPVGALFGLLDFNPRIKAIDGRLFPFGFLRLLWNKRGIKKSAAD